MCLCSVHVYISYVNYAEIIILGSLQICDELQNALCYLYQRTGIISMGHKSDTVFFLDCKPLFDFI